MPVGSVGKWLVLGTLVAALGASGCKEDDGGEDDPVDSGRVDAGNTPTDSGNPTTDAGNPTTDAGMDAGGISCGQPPVACTGHMTGLGPVAPGCARNYADAEVCGISSANVLAGADPKFLEKNAPGAPSPSCAAFVDSREQPLADGGVYPDGGGKGNGRIDSVRNISALTIYLNYPGCCTKRGFCSGFGTEGMAATAGTYAPSDNGYGCMESTIFFGPTSPAAMIPCDPNSGMIMLPPPADGGTDGGTDGGASDAGADGGNG